MEKPVAEIMQNIQAVVPNSGAAVAEFCSHLHLRELKPDEFFVREGQVCRHVGFLQSGMIRHYYTNANEEVTRWMSLEGEFVTALSSFIQSSPSNHHLQAINRCTLWVIEREVWQQLYARHESLRELWLRLLELNVIGFEDRLYQQLSGDAEQRYLYFLKNYPRFLEKVPQKYIASMIGIKAESLSRVRAKLGKRIS